MPRAFSQTGLLRVAQIFNVDLFLIDDRILPVPDDTVTRPEAERTGRRSMSRQCKRL